MAMYIGLEAAWKRRLFTDCCQKGTLFPLQSNGEQRSVQNLCSDVKSYENSQPDVSI